MNEFRSMVFKGESREIVVKKNDGRPRQKPNALSDIAVVRQETRKTNQRREDRLLNVVDRAVITFRRKHIEVDVINASSFGVMIKADIEPKVGERIHIQFQDCNRTECNVRWVKGRRIGLEFANKTVLIAPPEVQEYLISGRRGGETPPRLELKPERPQRHNLLWSGVLHIGIESMIVKLRNISSAGAMLDCAEDIPVGTTVVLEFGGSVGEAVSGKVKWCRWAQAGIGFDEPFDLRVLADARPPDPTEVVVPRYVKPDYLAMEDENSPWAARTYGLRPEDL